MEDFYSKYPGAQIEGFLDQIANGGAGGGGGSDIGVETDPIFSASPAASITEEKKAEWDNKVDKVEGKQLSTEDFTTALKNKLNSLNNYDDSAIQQAVNSLRSDFNTLVSGNTTTAIESFNEIMAFLDGITDSESLDGIIAGIQLEIAKKQVELISGVNIKTINGQSILGSGNIQIESNYSLPAATTNTRGGVKIGSGVVVDNTDVLHAKVNESTGLSITNNGIEIKLGTGLKVGDQNRIETKLKTINGQPIEGSGNITIEGGGSGSAAYPLVIIEGDTAELLPNTYYTSDRSGALNVILGEPLEEEVSEYVFCLYNEGTDNLSVSFEENIMWANGAPPFHPFCYTEVSIIDYRGVWVEFKDA